MGWMNITPSWALYLQESPCYPLPHTFHKLLEIRFPAFSNIGGKTLRTPFPPNFFWPASWVSFIDHNSWQPRTALGLPASLPSEDCRPWAPILAAVEKVSELPPAKSSHRLGVEQSGRPSYASFLSVRFEKVSAGVKNKGLNNDTQLPPQSRRIVPQKTYQCSHISSKIIRITTNKYEKARINMHDISRPQVRMAVKKV